MKTRFTMIVLFSLVTATITWGHMELFQNALPNRIDSWESRDKGTSYNRKALYKYINGGAELYLTYDFKKVYVKSYAQTSGHEIICEIYDMGTSAEAFGIFSIEREDEGIGIGQDSEYGGGLLRFWKDRYFISLITTGEIKTAKPAMFKLARMIAGMIDIEGSPPALLNLLPRKELHEKSVRFFHTADILNRQYFLSDKNILNLERHTDCALASYGKDNHAARLLLIQYPSNSSAKEALNTFLTVYMPEAETSRIAQMEDKTWAMIKHHNNILAVVVDATTKDFGNSLLSKIEWNKK